MIASGWFAPVQFLPHHHHGLQAYVPVTRYLCNAYVRLFPAGTIVPESSDDQFICNKNMHEYQVGGSAKTDLIIGALPSECGLE